MKRPILRSNVTVFNQYCEYLFSPFSIRLFNYRTKDSGSTQGQEERQCIKLGKPLMHFKESQKSYLSGKPTFEKVNLITEKFVFHVTHQISYFSLNNQKSLGKIKEITRESTRKILIKITDESSIVTRRKCIVLD